MLPGVLYARRCCQFTAGSPPTPPFCLVIPSPLLVYLHVGLYARRVTHVDSSRSSRVYPPPTVYCVLHYLPAFPRSSYYVTRTLPFPCALLFFCTWLVHAFLYVTFLRYVPCRITSFRSFDSPYRHYVLRYATHTMTFILRCACHPLRLPRISTYTRSRTRALRTPRTLLPTTRLVVYLFG